MPRPSAPCSPAEVVVSAQRPAPQPPRPQWTHSARRRFGLRSLLWGAAAVVPAALVARVTVHPPLVNATLENQWTGVFVDATAQGGFADASQSGGFPNAQHANLGRDGASPNAWGVVEF